MCYFFAQSKRSTMLTWKMPFTIMYVYKKNSKKKNERIKGSSRKVCFLSTNKGKNKMQHA